MSSTQKLIGVAMFIALGVVLPLAFHLAGAGGSVFLPMHIPVLMAGLLLGSQGGLAAGALTPVLSSLLTGMPPLLPVLPIMVVELGVYGLSAGYLYQKRNVPLVWSLVGAMLTGRLAAGLAVAAIGGLLQIKIQPLAYLLGVFSTGLPGMAIQLIFIPLLVKKLQAGSVTFRQVKNGG
ncbi:hypothetical protein SCACP_06060 [Sporomusa carbonis]|uniref:ECF transporter S component n=1 Tax=Sporomusa carbonis TaxID=3076075 RepID=UPI003A647894